jgi:hypothetical protein
VTLSGNAMLRFGYVEIQTFSECENRVEEPKSLVSMVKLLSVSGAAESTRQPFSEYHRVR